jgi:cytoskeletal protein CcmA (bactofilin family)
VAGAVTESTGPYVQEAARNTKETLSGSKSTIQEEARDLILRSLQKQTGGAEDTKEEPKAKDIIKPEEADGKQKVDQDPEVDKRLKIEKAIEEKFYSKKTQSELNEELIRKREEERLAEELKTLLGLAEASDSSAKEIAAEKQQSTPIPAPTPVPVPKTVPIPKTIPIPKQVPVPNPISVPKTVPVPKPIPNSAKGIQSTLDSDTNTLTGESSAPILSSGAGSVLSTSLEDSPGAATAAAVTGAISEVVSEMSKVSDEAGKDTSDISSKKLSKKEKQRLGKLEQKKLKLNKETELPVAGEQIPQIDMENLEKGIHIDPEDRIKMAAAQVSEQSAANADKVTGKLLKQPDDSDQAGENNNAAKRLSKKEKKRLSKLEQQRIKQNQAEKEKIQVAGEAVPVAGEQIQIEEKAKSEKEETSLKNPPMELKEVIEKEKTPFWKVWLDKIRDLFLQSFKKEKFPALQGIEDLSNAAEASRVVVEHDDGFVNAIEGLIEGSVRGESIILEVHSVIKSDVVVTDYFYSKAKTVVFGNVYAKKVIVEGSIRGDIHASHSVEVKDGGCVFGNVQAPSISIDAKGYIAGNLNYEKGDMK